VGERKKTKGDEDGTDTKPNKKNGRRRRGQNKGSCDYDVDPSVASSTVLITSNSSVRLGTRLSDKGRLRGGGFSLPEKPQSKGSAARALLGSSLFSRALLWSSLFSPPSGS
jgi:hypothetical protein